eukprot:gene5297-biopygen12342
MTSTASTSGGRCRTHPFMYSGTSFSEWDIIMTAKICEQLVTLKTGSSQAFVRDLDPELFHWHGTRVTFMSLQLLKGFWKKKEEKLQCPCCKKHTIVSNGWAPSLRRMCMPSGTHYLSYMQYKCDQCVGASHSKVDYQRLRMSMVAGEYLCIDDNFQLPKYIRDSDGTPLFTAMTTVMNEYNEVCARCLKPDQSYKTVMGALGLVAKRYDKEGVKVYASAT